MFVDDDHRITGSDALDQALKIAQGFADRGVRTPAVLLSTGEVFPANIRDQEKPGLE